MYGTQQPPPPDGTLGGPLGGGIGGGHMASSSPIPQQWWDQDAGVPMQHQQQLPHHQQQPHSRPPTQQQMPQQPPPLQQQQPPQQRQPPNIPSQQLPQAQPQQNLRSVTPSMANTRANITRESYENNPAGRSASPSPYTAGNVGAPPNARAQSPSPGPPLNRQGAPGAQYNSYRNPAAQQGVGAYRTVAPSPTPSINANGRTSPGPGGFNAVAQSPARPGAGTGPGGPAAGVPYGASYTPNSYGASAPGVGTHVSGTGGPVPAGGPPLQPTPASGAASPINVPGHGAVAAPPGAPVPATTPPSAPGSAPAAPPRPPSSTGLIRLTLRKPMGIVFEPMTDPHNSAQQRGVRICDLPRTGAAALSRKLEVGDELLSINDKTMSRLTFDEIMDFIIEADPDKVNLLFRRPRKESLMMKKPLGSQGGFESPTASNNPSVKWMDESEAASQTSSKVDKKKSRNGSDGRDRDRDRNGKSSGRDKENRSDSQKGSSRNHRKRDEVSVVSGESSKYTRESTVQSAGTRETDRDGADGHNGRKSKSQTLGSRKLNSENFLDMLIDSLCSPLVSADACRGQEKNKSRDRENDGDDDYYSDEDDDDRTFDSAGDSTYVTYEDTLSVDRDKKGRNDNGQKKNGKDKSKHSSREDDTYNMDEDDDDDGTRTYEEDEGTLQTDTDTDNHLSRGANADNGKMSSDAHNWKMGKGGRGGVAVLSPPQEADEDIPEGNYEDDATLETVETLERAKEAASAVVAAASVQSPPLGLAPQSDRKKKMGGDVGGGMGEGVFSRDPVSRNKSPMGMRNAMDMPPEQPKQMQEASLSYDADTNLPISELEYDDRVDADVSVMESLGGPSLLIEAQRHNAAVAAGAAAAATNSPTVAKNAVSPEIIAMYGREYPEELGFTREETVNRNPGKFYSFVVRRLLEQNEPEKVRLLDKLLDKYSGREPHLIEKLAVRYKKQQMQANAGGNINGVNKASSKNAGRATPPTIEEGNEEDHHKNESSEQRESAKARGMKVSSSSPQGRKKFESPSPAGDDGWPPPIGSKEEKKGKGADFGSSPPDRSEGKSANRGKPKPESDDDRGGDRTDDDETASYTTDSEYSGDSIDGTSPAVIAQVSELLNYVYGKTSVPGQIDRVSTIMRAYEGREAVLLELLETKALIKANAENEAANNLPASLRNSPALAASRQQMDPDQPQQQMQAQTPQSQQQQIDPSIVHSPVSALTSINSPINTDDGGGSSGMKADDVSSLSGGDEFNAKGQHAVSSPNSNTIHTEERPAPPGANGKIHTDRILSATSSGEDCEAPRRKKSGLFGMFRGKKGKKGKGGESGGAFPTTSDGAPISKSGKKGYSPKNGSKKGGLLNRVGSTEGSI